MDQELKKNVGQKLNSNHAQNLSNRQINIEVEKFRVHYEKMYEAISSEKLKKIEKLETLVKTLNQKIAEKDDVIYRQHMEMQMQTIESNKVRNSYENRLLELQRGQSHESRDDSTECSELCSPKVLGGVFCNASRSLLSESFTDDFDPTKIGLSENKVFNMTILHRNSQAYSEWPEPAQKLNSSLNT